MFVWGNEEQDLGISIRLDFTGNLISLAIEKNERSSNLSTISIEERKKRAEEFLLSHYPDALNQLTFTRTKEHTDSIQFTYEQIVMGLPLDHAGSWIDVDPNGNIIRFAYYGVKQIPEIPELFISKEKLIEDVQNGLDFQLTITNLYQALHHVEEDGLRLVYEPTQHFMTYKAGVLKPTLTIEQEEAEVETLYLASYRVKVACQRSAIHRRDNRRS